MCFSPLLTEMSGKTPMSQVTRPRQTMEMTWAARRRSAMITLVSVRCWHHTDHCSQLCSEVEEIVKTERH